MRWVGVILAFALGLDLPTTGGSAAQTVAATVENAGGATPHAAKSALIADCTETLTPSPLSPRPVLRRTTYAAKPSRPHRHHARRGHKRHHARQVKRHIVHHTKRLGRHHARRSHPARHRPALHRVAVHRVTYASPLCGQRSEIINDMLGLPGVTQSPVAAETIADTLPTFIDLPPAIGTGPGPIIVGPIGPGPIYPVGPGPIIIGPPGPPVSPPVTPPVTSPVPEPASWASLLIGMMLVGGTLRRRRLSRMA